MGFEGMNRKEFIRQRGCKAATAEGDACAMAWRDGTSRRIWENYSSMGVFSGSPCRFWDLLPFPTLV